MEVTGQQEMRTDKVEEVKKFVSTHLEELEDQELSIRRTGSEFVMELRRTDEPAI